MGEIVHKLTVGLEKLRLKVADDKNLAKRVRSLQLALSQLLDHIDSNYISLPVDAEGVAIHVGDRLESLASEKTCIVEGIGKPVKGDCIIIISYDNDVRFITNRASKFRHAKPATLGELLDEYADKRYSYSKDGRPAVEYDELRDEYEIKVRSVFEVNNA